MLRLALHLLLLAAWGCADATRAPTPLPSPDAGVCEVSFLQTAGLVLNPSDVRELVARVQPSREGLTVRLGLIGSALDASLDRSTAVTAADGAVRFTLTAPTSAAGFQVRASADCGAEAQLGVTVDPRGTGAIDAEALYRGNREPSAVTVDLLRADSCDVAATATVERTAQLPAPGGSVQFSGLIDGVSYVLRATATGVARTVLADACAGPLRAEAGVRRPGVLRFTDRASTLVSSYDLSLTFNLGDHAASSVDRWLAPLRAETRAAGGEAQLFLPELADAVARSVPPELGAAARQTLVQALQGELGLRLGEALVRQGAGVDLSLQRLAEQTAAGVARVRLRALLSAPTGEQMDWRASSIEALLDPGTPDVQGDDVAVAFDEVSTGRLARSGGESVVGSLTALPLPYARLARRTLSAVVQRFGAASSGEYIALAACPVVASQVTAVSALCGERCVLAACRLTADRLSRTFDDAVARVDAQRAVVDLGFTAAGRVAPGTLRIARVDALAAGAYRDDPGARVLASATLTAAP